MKYKMDDAIFGVLGCIFLGIVIMLIFSGERNTRRSHIKICECDDWLFDGENGSKTGAFFKCKKCSRTKYISYKELMSMSEEDYNYWSNRPPTDEEQYRQNVKNKTNG
jgi:hypothetical protein